jgi:hypothetical protein
MPVIRSLRACLLLIAAVVVPGTASAVDAYPDSISVPASPAAESGARRGSDFWFTAGVGRYDAKDYPRGADATHDGTHIGGGEADIALSYAWLDSGLMLRLRSNYLIDFTSNTAEELALSGGVALGSSRTFWITTGVSRLTDVSNTRQAPSVGIPVELIWYPVHGLELMVHGNFNDDRKFYGVVLGWAIGHRPAD